MSFSPNSPYSSGLRVDNASARVIPEPGNPLISFREIHKAFGENKVLTGVNLEVYPGKTMAVLGRSGSGKTAIFGLIIGTVGCYHGFNTTHGTFGVGQATKTSVVRAILLILVADVFLTKITILLWP